MLKPHLKLLLAELVLLPLDVQIHETFETPTGSTPLLQLIHVSEYATAAAKKLLGRTAVVSTIQTAIELQRTYSDWRFVTQQGELVETDGRVYVGKSSSGDQNGWLTRRIEISALKVEVSALDQQIDQRQSQLGDLLHESEQARQQQRTSAKRVRDARNAVVEYEYQLQRFDDDIHRCTRTVKTFLQEELEELVQRIVESESQFNTANTESTENFYSS